MLRTRKNNRYFFVLLMLLSLMLIACGDDDDGDDDNGGDDAPAASALSASFEVAGLTVNHPEGWAALDDNGSMYVADSNDYLEAFRAVDPGGDVAGEGIALSINIVPKEQLPADDAQAVYDLLSSVPAEDDIPELTYSDATAFSAADGLSGVRGEATNTNGEAAFFVLENDEVFVLAAGTSNDFGAAESTIDSIMATASYSAPAE